LYLQPHRPVGQHGVTHTVGCVEGIGSGRCETTPDRHSRISVHTVKSIRTLNEHILLHIECGLAVLLADDLPDLLRVCPVEPADLAHKLQDLLLVDDAILSVLSDLIDYGMDVYGLHASVLDVDVIRSRARVQRARSRERIDVA